MSVLGPKEWQDAKRKLVAQFQIPAPTVCVCLLISWACYVHVPGVSLHTASQEKVDRYVNKMFDIIWEWITRPRSDEEMKAVIGMQCSCSAHERRVNVDHKHGEEVYVASKGAPGWSLIRACFYPASHAHDIMEGTMLTTPPHELYRRLKWPQSNSVRNILPHGPARTLQSVCQWLKLASDIRDRIDILSGLELMIAMVQPLVVPHLILSSGFLVGAGVVTQAINLPDILSTDTGKQLEFEDMLTDCQSFIPLMFNTIFGKLNATERKILHNKIPAQLLEIYECSLLLSRRASAIVQYRRREDLRLLGSSGMTMYETAYRIHTLHDRIQQLARQLHEDCSERCVFDLSKKTHLELLSSDMVDAPKCPPIIQRIYLELKHLPKSQHCHAPACSKTVMDGRLRLCLGCRHMSYCSRRCQKRAWTSAQMGHRSACALFARYKVVDTDLQVSPGGSEEHERVLDHLEQLTLTRLRALNPGTELRVR
jgi:hypothetical protein